MTKPRVAVVGAGIVGAAIAFRLAEAGAAVTLIDRAGPGAGASGKSFGWINANDPAPAAYHLFRREAITAWRRLEGAVETPIRWGGSLSWELDEAALRAQATELAALGCPARLIDGAEVRRLAPAVASPPDLALLAEEEAAVDAGIAAARLGDAAAALGATRLIGADVSELVVKAGRVTGVSTSFGLVAADMVILAAGVGAASLAASAGVRLPMDDRKGLIVRTLPVAPVIDRLILTPEVHFRQEPDGRLIVGEIFSGDGPGASMIERDARALAAMILDRLCARLPGVEGIALGELTLGLRPTPSDGFPIIGHAAEGLYLAVMHSGVTLAPLVAEHAAAEVVRGTDMDALAPYRLDRFG